MDSAGNILGGLIHESDARSGAGTVRPDIHGDRRVRRLFTLAGGASGRRRGFLACIRVRGPAVTTSLASDIAHPPCLSCARCPETGVNYVVKPDTAGGTDQTCV